MATEIVRWCDAHLETEEHVPGSPVELTIGKRSGTIDLCDDHGKALVGPLLDMLAPSPKALPKSVTASGVRAGRPPGPDSHTLPVGASCPLCEYVVGGITPSGASLHLRTYHDTTMTMVMGPDCPLCDFVATGTGMGNHATKTHDLPSVWDLWFAAVAAGDPVGVIARRRAALHP